MIASFGRWSRNCGGMASPGTPAVVWHKGSSTLIRRMKKRAVPSCGSLQNQGSRSRRCAPTRGCGRCSRRITTPSLRLETQQLVAEIKLGLHEPQPDIPNPPARLAAAATIAPRIALMVEAFAVDGVGPRQARLAEDFRHDLMAHLVRLWEWFVVEGLTSPAFEATGERVSARYRIGARAYRTGRADHHGADPRRTGERDLCLERTSGTEARRLVRHAAACTSPHYYRTQYAGLVRAAGAHRRRTRHTLAGYDRWFDASRWCSASALTTGNVPFT